MRQSKNGSLAVIPSARLKLVTQENTKAASELKNAV
jgi:hypothetical protein